MSIDQIVLTGDLFRNGVLIADNVKKTFDCWLDNEPRGPHLESTAAMCDEFQMMAEQNNVITIRTVIKPALDLLGTTAATAAAVATGNTTIVSQYCDYQLAPYVDKLVTACNHVATIIQDPQAWIFSTSAEKFKNVSKEYNIPSVPLVLPTSITGAFDFLGGVELGAIEGVIPKDALSWTTEQKKAIGDFFAVFTWPSAKLNLEIANRMKDINPVGGMVADIKALSMVYYLNVINILQEISQMIADPIGYIWNGCVGNELRSGFDKFVDTHFKDTSPEFLQYKEKMRGIFKKYADCNERQLATTFSSI